MCLAIPGQVIHIEAPQSDTLRLASVAFGGIEKQVNLCFVPEARVGDHVLVHVGVALSVVDEAEALQTLDYLRRMGELDDPEQAPGGGSLP